ncbi:MAG: glutaredoxin domain-containing protein [Gammaproteobacteria bacterium]
MKKLIILALVIAAVYAYKPELFSFANNKGAFDEQGNAVTLVFTHNKCGKPCNDAVSLLKKRRVNYILYPLDNNDTNQALWKEYGGVNSFPNIIVGNERAYGSNKSRIVSALAMNYGTSFLNSTERYYMKKHFHDDGSNRLVMYAASWCGYCKKLRETLNDNNVDYVEIDVEKSSQPKAMTAALDITGYPLVYYGYKRLEGPRPRDVMALF